MDGARALTQDERERRKRDATQAAVVAGGRAALVAILLGGSVHLIGTSTTLLPFYRRLDAYAKRIAFALVVVGAFTFSSQLEGARLVQKRNVDDATAASARDAAVLDAHRRVAAMDRHHASTGARGPPGELR